MVQVTDQETRGVGLEGEAHLPSALPVQTQLLDPLGGSWEI